MSEENVVVDNSNTTEEEVLETSEERDEDVDDGQDTTDWKARAEKAEELARNQRIRAEKAERLAKTIKPTTNQEANTSGLTTRDYLALTNAKVHEDDISDVEEYAKFKNISLADALKSPVVQTIIKDKEEQRKTANATNVRNVRAGSTKVNPQDLIDKARKGEKIEDPSALAEAIMAEKLAKIKR